MVGKVSSPLAVLVCTLIGLLSLLLEGCWESGPTTCSLTSDTCCPQSQMVEKTANCSDWLKDDGTVDESVIRVAGEDLPKQLQGVFWLTEQGDSSSLMSFAKSDDGCGLSQGAGVNGSKDNFRLRTGGDRMWAFAEKAKSWALIRALDLVYNFQVTEGTAKDPKKFQIIPESLNLGFRLTATWLLDFDMNLLPMDKDVKGYEGSVVWARPSSVVGIEVKSQYYLLVQVVDGKGKPIQPAYDKWLKYSNSESSGKETNGYMHYHEASGTLAAEQAPSNDVFQAKAKAAAHCCQAGDDEQSCMKDLEEEVAKAVEEDVAKESPPQEEKTPKKNVTSRRLSDLTLKCPTQPKVTQLFTESTRMYHSSSGVAALAVAAVAASIGSFVAVRAFRARVQGHPGVGFSQGME